MIPLIFSYYHPLERIAVPFLGGTAFILFHFKLTMNSQLFSGRDSQKKSPATQLRSRAFSKLSVFSQQTLFVLQDLDL
jgi:hypothetical protein